MRIFKFLRSIVDTSYNGRLFVANIETCYRNHKKNFPGKNQHFYLAQTWLAYRAAMGENVNDKIATEVAFTVTYPFACLDPSVCARRLGIFILYKENPDVLNKCSELLEEFNTMVLPVLEAQENGKT